MVNINTDTNLPLLHLYNLGSNHNHVICNVSYGYAPKHIWLNVWIIHNFVCEFLFSFIWYKQVFEFMCFFDSYNIIFYDVFLTLGIKVFSWLIKFSCEANFVQLAMFNLYISHLICIWMVCLSAKWEKNGLCFWSSSAVGLNLLKLFNFTYPCCNLKWFENACFFIINLIYIIAH